MTEKTYKPILISSVFAKSNIKKCRFIDFEGNYSTAGAKAYGVADVETDKDEMLPVGFSDSEECNGYALDEASAAGEFIRIIRGI